MKETTLQTLRSVKKEGEKVLQAPEQRFPCSPWWRLWWGRLSPWSPWRSTVEQIPTCSPWRTPYWRRSMRPKEAVIPWRAHTGARSWKDLRILGEGGAHAGAGFLARLGTHAGAACSWSTAPNGRTHAGAVWEELQPVGRTHFGEVCEGCLPQEGPTLEQGKSVRSPPPEEEGAAEITRDELTTTPIPHPPAPLRGRR